MKILVSGATGFVGSALTARITEEGGRCIALSRSERGGARETIVWDPSSGCLDAAGLEGFDAVVHLAGENIGGGLWTRERKRRILESRVVGTRLLAEGLSRLNAPPRVFVCASAIGFYGSRGDETLHEGSSRGTGFLPDLVCAWEDAAAMAERGGIRTVMVRYGLILDPSGGALQKMLPAFRLGLGARLGDGKQQMSWITREDAVGLTAHLLRQESLRGPLNAVAPNPVTNAQFTRVLARVLRRPAPFVAPAFLLRAALGMMAEETLLTSQKVEPRRAIESGYRFRHPDLEDALLTLLRPPE